MNKKNLIKNIKKKQSFLCIGLDSDIKKIPAFLLKEKYPLFEFNKLIIEACSDLCIAYKINTAFYEALGTNGWKSLEKTMDIIPNDIFTIADAKRSDIGNTAQKYAEAFLGKSNLNFDAITLSPYMGHDSILPFLKYKNKWAIILALSSNEGAIDFQFLQLEISKLKLFEKVIIKTKEWGSEDNIMFVVGATKDLLLKNIRRIIPNHFLLIPGIGAQSGNINNVIKNGITKDIGIIINVSRDIIFCDNSVRFQEKVREKALHYKNIMTKALKEYSII